MVKPYITLIFLILTTAVTTGSFAQTAKLAGSITNRDTTMENAYWSVFLKQSSAVIKATSNDTKGDFMFASIAPGHYTLRFESIGYRTITIENLQILHDTVINVKYPEPCAFIYTTYLKKGKPECPIGNHTGNIVRIIYGLPSAKTMKKAKKGLVHLGGCVMYGCDPHYYCTLHNKEL